MLGREHIGILQSSMGYSGSSTQWPARKGERADVEAQGEILARPCLRTSDQGELDTSQYLVEIEV